MSINAEHLITYLRERCEGDFRFFVRYFFKSRKGSKFIFNAHHEEICEHLMKVWNGEIQNLIINIPPRYSKTELVIILFSAWCFVKNPRCEFIHLSYGDPLAMENSDAIKTIIKSDQFRQLWPELSITDNKDSKSAWGTREGGSFYAMASGGTVTGFGAGRMDEWDGNAFKFSGCLLIDDPLKPDDAHSDPLRNKVNRRWDETIKSRRNGNRTPTILIMQRIHEDDFAGMLINKDFENKWHVLAMPALIDEGLPTERALWPEKHSVKQLKAMQAKNEGMFASQMQQRPSPAGGGILKPEKFRLWPSTKPLPNLEFILQSYDTAFTEKTSGDPTGCQVWGLFTYEKRMNVILLDRWEERLSYPKLREKVMADWQAKYGGVKNDPMRPSKGADVIIVEDKGSGQSLLQDLRLANVPVFAYNPGRADKEARAHQWAAILESDNWWLIESNVEAGKPRKWARPMLSSLEQFPNGEHDEDVDCGSQTAIYLRDTRWLEVKSVPNEPSDRDKYSDYEERERVNPYDQ